MKTPVLLAAAALGAGLVARRRRSGATSRSNGATPPYSGPPAGAARTVAADDGVLLHVEVSGPEDAAATVVLAHGYVLSNRLWDDQVAALTAARPDLRVVTYDQRGHGRSGRTAAQRATIEQLGKDLLAVLDDVAPTGPVVLAGHSMGGMTLMALAEQHPELISERVAGVALVSTSAGRLAEVSWGLGVLGPVAQKLRPKLNEAARRRELAGKKALPQAGTRRLLFGADPYPVAVARTVGVMAGCSAHTVADFHWTFTDHDRLAALAALADIPTVVLVGTRDLLCPVDHSRALAQAVPSAQLTLFPGAGHMLQLERSPEVSAKLVELCDVLPRPTDSRRTRRTAVTP